MECPKCKNPLSIEIGQYYQWGIIFQLDENAEHSLIAAKNLGSFSWDEAKQKCEELELNEYDDWYLPSIDELDILIKSKDQIGGFTYNSNYWSSSEYGSDYAWYHDGFHPHYNNGSTYAHYYVRAVRAF